MAALDEIDRILRQMLVLSELSAGDGNINRTNLPYTICGDYMDKLQIEKYEMFGLNVSYYRRKCKLTQDQLAEMGLLLGLFALFVLLILGEFHGVACAAAGAFHLAVGQVILVHKNVRAAGRALHLEPIIVAAIAVLVENGLFHIGQVVGASASRQACSKIISASW